MLLLILLSLKFFSSSFFFFNICTIMYLSFSNTEQVQENSPGHRAGLEPFFDFIVSINNTRLVRQACVSGRGLFVPVVTVGAYFCPAPPTEQGQ